MPSHLNISVIADVALLRVVGETVVHLVRTAREDRPKREAVTAELLGYLNENRDPDEVAIVAELATYPAADLALEVWSPQTLCRRTWSRMATRAEEAELRTGDEHRATGRYQDPEPRSSQLECMACTRQFRLPGRNS